MLEIKRFIFGPFATNCYVVSDSDQIWIIDPACSVRYEQQELEQYITRLQASSPRSVSILATHGHLDHLWGAKWACERWEVPVMIHPDDIPMAEAMQTQYDLFGVRKKAEAFPIAPLPSTLPPFTVIHTPGHTPGSVCLYAEKEKRLFSGDTLFQMGYGRTDLPGGDMMQLIHSLEHLFTLPADVRVYPGHGEETTIQAERR